MMNSSTLIIKKRFLWARSNSRFRLIVFGNPDSVRLPRHHRSGSSLWATSCGRLRFALSLAWVADPGGVAVADEFTSTALFGLGFVGLLHRIRGSSCSVNIGSLPFEKSTLSQIQLLVPSILNQKSTVTSP